MKELSTLLLVLILTACSSSGNKETAGQDSVAAVSDTTITESEAVYEEGIEEEGITEEEMSDTSQLITFYEQMSARSEKFEVLYKVYITTSQYEASSDVTWNFDADFSPVYFMESWAAEGNEGFTEFFIDGGDVVCASSQESGEEKKWCRPTGGLRIYDGGSGDLLSEPLPDEYGTGCNTELKNNLDILTSILNEAEITEEDDDSYTLKKEWTVNVGEDVTESVTVSIPKKLYKSIVGE